MGMLSTALVFAALSGAMALFPDGPPALRSPDGTWRITNEDPLGADAPHRLLLGRSGGAERPLYSYGRHVRVAWSPDSRRIAITDYSESTSADCYVIDASSLMSVNVAEVFKRTSKRIAHIMANDDHSFFECLAWTSNRDLRVRASGHGNFDPNGATFTTTYRLAQ